MYSIGCSMVSHGAPRLDNVETLMDIEECHASKATRDSMSSFTTNSNGSRQSSTSPEDTFDKLAVLKENVKMLALTTQIDTQHLSLLQELELCEMGYMENDCVRTSIEAALDDSRSEVIPACVFDTLPKPEIVEGKIFSRRQKKSSKDSAFLPRVRCISGKSIWRWQQMPPAKNTAAEQAHVNDTEDPSQASFLRMSAAFSTVDTDIERPSKHFSASSNMSEQSFKDALPSLIPERRTSFGQRPSKRRDPRLTIFANKSLLSVAEGEELPRSSRSIIDESSCLSPMSFASSRTDSLDGGSSFRRDSLQPGLAFSTDRALPQPKRSMSSLRSRITPSQASTFWSITSHDSEAPARRLLSKQSQASIKSLAKEEEDASAWDPDSPRKNRKKSSKSLKAEKATLWAKSEVARILDEPFSRDNESSASLKSPQKGYRRNPFTLLSNDSQLYGSESSTPTQGPLDGTMNYTKRCNSNKDDPFLLRHQSLGLRSE